MPSIDDIEYLRDEYAEDLNNGVKAEGISANYRKKVWWRCRDHGHTFRSVPESRYRMRTRCPYCVNKRVLEGFNDLATLRPDLLKDWDYAANVVKPNEIMPGGTQEAHWLCHLCGFKWRTRAVRERAVTNNGCPECARGKKSSFPEQVIYTVLKERFPRVINNFRHGGYEIDIGVPELNLCIEYNGCRWHKGGITERDVQRKKYIMTKNARLLIIVENVENKNGIDYENDLIYYSVKSGGYSNIKFLVGMVQEYINKKYIGEKIVLEYAEKHRVEALNRSKKVPNEKSVGYLLDNVCKELECIDNGVDVYSIHAGGNTKLLMRCKVCENEFSQYVRRIKNGCNVCKGARVNVGVNDLATLRKDLLEEWDFSGNKEISPTEISLGSNRKVSWVCKECGHRWVTNVHHRTKNNSGCPECYRTRKKTR